MGSEQERRPRIAEFYNGRSLLVTGVTGFMGKLLVEKLIWSCPGLERVYVLMRPKRELDSQQRLDNIINTSLFSRLRENRKEDLKKIILLEGDVSSIDLGLTLQQKSEVCQNVSIVFHCAASVKFDDPLPLAIDINVKGTKCMVDLALQMPKLVSFIYVSTAYSNCNHFNIEEKIYPAQADWSKTLLVKEKIDPATFNILSNKYMNHMPNTYVFSKSLAEHIVADHADRLPVVIFRPSIVTSVLEEPLPGWVDSLYGPNGLAVACGCGIVRTILVDTRIQPDFMPADLAIKGLIVSAYARVYKKQEGVQLYNWCSNDLSITYNDFKGFAMVALQKMPFKYMIWNPTDSSTTSYTWFYFNFALFQLFPAFFIDAILWACGIKPLLSKIQRKIFIAISALTHFLLNYFHFKNDNLFSLEKFVLEEDLEEFNFVRRPSPSEIQKYFEDSAHINGIWLFKMTPKDWENSRILKKILYWLDIIVKSGFFVFLTFKIYSWNLIPYIIQSTIGFLLNF